MNLGAGVAGYLKRSLGDHAGASNFYNSVGAPWEMGARPAAWLRSPFGLLVSRPTEATPTNPAERFIYILRKFRDRYCYFASF